MTTDKTQAPPVDTSMAAAYQAALVPGLMAPWGEAIAAEARLSAGMNVLDVACGTGVATRSAARRCGARGRVVGIDIDLGMLAVAASESQREGLVIEYVHGSVCALPFEPGSFDAVLCLQGLQYFPDPRAAMYELGRVLRPVAPLVVMTWSTLPTCKAQWAMVTALEERGIDAAAARKPFSWSDDATLAALANDAGFARVSVRKEQRMARFPSVASFVESMQRGAPSTRLALDKVPPAEWSRFLGDVEGFVAEWARPSMFEFPVECNVLEACRHP
jgi:ubiquinone/menaquinone biosynthesis C-methylase UbiE